MELILNDFSINGQFASEEDFLDSLQENTLPLLKKLCCKENNLYKAYGTYDCRLYNDVTLHSFVRSRGFHAYPEISVLKRYLSELMDDPYWEDDPRTCRDAVYESSFTGEFRGDSPNCFSEALERGGILLSFEHMDFQGFKIDLWKNKELFPVPNCFNRETLSEYLFAINQIGFSEYLMSKSYPKEVVLRVRMALTMRMNRI